MACQNVSISDTQVIEITFETNAYRPASLKVPEGKSRPIAIISARSATLEV